MSTGAAGVRGPDKRFGQQVAVAGIDLEPPAGGSSASSGRRGPGRPTTLSMATGPPQPDQGEVEVVGHDVRRDPAGVKARIGALPEGCGCASAHGGTAGGGAAAGDPYRGQRG